MRKIRKAMLPLLLIALLLCGCAGNPFNRIVKQVDPYAGLVQVESGYGTQVWVKEYEELAENPFLGCQDLNAASDGYEILYGMDVSEHQGKVDWKAAADSGIDFAIIRAAYRAYGESGALFADPFFEANIRGARENGIEVGVYIFSQAISTDEAIEEADFLLDLLRDHRDDITLPVFFDWEDLTHVSARTNGTGGELITDFAVAFCERIRAAGCVPGVYAYRSLAYYDYDLSRIADYTWWIAALGDVPDFHYAHEFWQRSIEPDVHGVAGDVDLDVWFRPKQ